MHWYDFWYWSWIAIGVATVILLVIAAWRKPQVYPDRWKVLAVVAGLLALLGILAYLGPVR